MKKTLSYILAISCFSGVTFGQGQFLFNTRDLEAGNDVHFELDGFPATGSNLFVEVLYGKDVANFTPLLPLLPLNRTGTGAGYTSPFAQIFDTPLPGGTAVNIAYRFFQGDSYATAPRKSELISSVLGQSQTARVILSEPPTPPHEVFLGNGKVAISLPEFRVVTAWSVGIGAFWLYRLLRALVAGGALDSAKRR